MGCTSLENIRASITDAAMKTIGFAKNNKNHWIQNPVVERLSNQQKELRLRITSTVNNEMVIELERQHNRIIHDIANILNEDKYSELDNLASKIGKCHNDNTQMYQVIKFIDKNLYKMSLFMTKIAETLQNLTQFTTSLEILQSIFKKTQRNQN